MPASGSDIICAQVELWKKYTGRLSEIWFDGGDDLPGVNEALAAYQPQAVYFGCSMPYNNLRWVGTESGEPSYPVWSNANPGENGQGRPDGTLFAPAESDTTLSPFDEWFWKPAYTYRTLSDLKVRTIAVVALRVGGCCAQKFLPHA